MIATRGRRHDSAQVCATNVLHAPPEVLSSRCQENPTMSNVATIESRTRAWSPTVADTMPCLDHVASVVDIEASRIDVNAMRTAIDAWVAAKRPAWSSDQGRTMRQQMFWALGVYDAEAWR